VRARARRRRGDVMVADDKGPQIIVSPPGSKVVVTMPEGGTLVRVITVGDTIVCATAPTEPRLFRIAVRYLQSAVKRGQKFLDGPQRVVDHEPGRR
jgi:hypothetical protein